ncbi:hypothetical protein, partial [Desulfonatronum thioautotrophicum]|uniref:hypothetical protein n=1 Tax=Desulfonatronum thioautotrophicum TaxID=617001 RepID=UPI0005EB4908
AEIIATSEPVREVLGLHSYQNWDEAWTPTAGETQRTFVQAVYRNLFNREPEAAQMDLFLDLILTQSVTPGRIGGEIIRDAMQENAVDWITLWNKIQVAEHAIPLTPAWSPDGLIIIRQILTEVTDDQATVHSAKIKMDRVFSQ